MPATAGLFTHIKYSILDRRLMNPATSCWGKLTSGEDASLFSMGGLLGLGGRLWRLHDWSDEWYQVRWIEKDQEWFLKLKTPILELDVEEWVGTNEYKFQLAVYHDSREVFDMAAFNAWVEKLKTPILEGTNEYKFQLADNDSRKPCELAALYAWVENVTHVLVRLQRWAKRMLRRARVRLVLLMALHPRLGAKAGIGALGPDLLLALALL